MVMMFIEADSMECVETILLISLSISYSRDV